MLLTSGGIAVAQKAASTGNSKLKAASEAPITINIGEKDVSPLSGSGVSGISAGSRDAAIAPSQTQNMEQVFASEKAEAQKKAKDAATPYDAFPSYVTVFALDAIHDDYMKMQQAALEMGEKMKGGFRTIDSKEKLEEVKGSLDLVHNSAVKLEQTIKNCPGDVADKLVQQGYDQVSISKRLSQAFMAGPLPAVKKRVDDSIRKAEVLQSLVGYMDKYWGKWKLDADGSLSVSSEIPAADRDGFHKAFVDASVQNQGAPKS